MQTDASEILRTADASRSNMNFSGSDGPAGWRSDEPASERNPGNSNTISTGFAVDLAAATATPTWASVCTTAQYTRIPSWPPTEGTWGPSSLGLKITLVIDDGQST